MSADAATTGSAISDNAIRLALLAEFRRMHNEQPYTNQILELEFRRFVEEFGLSAERVVRAMQDLLGEGLLTPQAVTLTNRAEFGRAKITQAGLEGWARLDPMAASVDITDGGNGGEMLFTHSDDYRTVTWKGQRYLLTARQAEFVECLDRARLAGRPEVSATTIAGRLFTEADNIRGIFRGRNRALWGEGSLVEVVPGRKGFYRLNP